MRDPVRFSDNPKMDNSGIRAEIPRYTHPVSDKPGVYPPPVRVKGRVVTGGEIYAEAIDEDTAVVTDKVSLQKAAGYINNGLSIDHAVDTVAEEIIYPAEEAD